MGRLILFYGSPREEVKPTSGFPSDAHDYGRGFYLGGDLELAKEWSVYLPGTTKGYVHQYELDTDGLKLVDYTKEGVLAWISELMRHRSPDCSFVKREEARRFIEPSDDYDVAQGWRADASYYFICEKFY